MPTSFSKPINNISTTVAADYTAGSGSLTVSNATGISIGAGEWVRVSTFRGTTPLSILKATAIVGNVLTITGAVSGENPTSTDVNLIIGDLVQVCVTAGEIIDLNTAVNTNETSITSLTNAKLSTNGDGSAVTVLSTGSTTARTLAAREARVLNVLDFGAVGDGVTDDATAINAAISAAGTAGCSVYLPGKTFGMVAPITGARTNVLIFGEAGKTIIKKLTSGATTASLMTVGLPAGSYLGYTFDGIEFQGNSVACAAAVLPGATLNLSNGIDRVTFQNCIFRDMTAGVTLTGSRRIRFLFCRFYGTISGVMQAGVQDPTPVPTAVNTSGILIGNACYDTLIQDCLFHSCTYGVQVNCVSPNYVNGLRILDCTFRHDWWNPPYKTYGFPKDAGSTYTPASSVNWYYPPGGFLNLFASTSDYRIVMFRYIVPGSGDTSFTTLYANNVIDTNGTPFANARIGDSIETADGRRAEIINVVSSTSVMIQGWESINTQEMTLPPANATAWRLSRYYSCVCSKPFAAGGPDYDKTMRLYNEPANPFTGERIKTDAGIDLTQCDAYLTALTNYSGVQVNYGVQGLLVRGCTFRGSWADQCSVFDSLYPQIIGNRFEYGQDVGVTLTRSIRAICSDNVFRMDGTFAVGTSFCDSSTIHGNTFFSWGCTNRSVLGAILIVGGTNIVITGNTCQYMTGGTGWGGASPHMVHVWSGTAPGSGYCDGLTITGNNDGGTKISTLRVDAPAVQNGYIIVRDVKSFTGDMSRVKGDNGVIPASNAWVDLNYARLGGL